MQNYNYKYLPDRAKYDFKDCFPFTKQTFLNRSIFSIDNNNGARAVYLKLAADKKRKFISRVQIRVLIHKAYCTPINVTGNRDEPVLAQRNHFCTTVRRTFL